MVIAVDDVNVAVAIESDIARALKLGVSRPGRTKCLYERSCEVEYLNAIIQVVGNQ